VGEYREFKFGTQVGCS